MSRKKNWIRTKMRAPNAGWRQLPPTDRQLAVLARIARENTDTVSTTLTRGEASDIINARAANDVIAARALRRAERARRRAQRRDQAAGDGAGRQDSHA
jgi:hypothetical protein